MSINDIREGDVLCLNGSFDFYLGAYAGELVAEHWPEEKELVRDVKNTAYTSTIIAKDEICEITKISEDCSVIVVKFRRFMGHYCTSGDFLSFLNFTLHEEPPCIETADLMVLLAI